MKKSGKVKKISKYKFGNEKKNDIKFFVIQQFLLIIGGYNF